MYAVQCLKNVTCADHYAYMPMHYADVPGGKGGPFLVNCVPMHEQRTAKLTLLNSVYLKLIPLFTVSCQKVTLSNEVN